MGATLGDAVFADIDKDPYLNELYENILYNCSLELFQLRNGKSRPVNIEDALRFADLLSKSTDARSADKHSARFAPLDSI